MKIVLALILSLVSALANATVMTYSFTGRIDTLARGPHFGDASSIPLFDNLVHVGALLSGTVTFDTAGGHDDFIEPAPLNTTYYPDIVTLQLQGPSALNALQAPWKPGYLSVSTHQTWPDGRPRDVLTSGIGAELGDGRTLGLWLSAEAKDPGAFRAYDIPYGYQDLVNGRFRLIYSHNGPGPIINDEVTGAPQFTLLDPDPALNVPEPATGLLLLAGLAAFAPLRRRRGLT